MAESGEQADQGAAREADSARTLSQPAWGMTPGATEFPELLDDGRYLREIQLGCGGMGIVYRYRDKELDRLVAVKALPPDRATRAAWRERLVAEARILAAFEHPNIGGIKDILTEDGVVYLVLEYVPGETLSKMIRAGGLGLDTSLDVGAQVARAVAAGHAKRFIHRDIKPANVMLTPEGTAKLLDWGLACPLDDDSLSAVTARDARANPRAAAGTAGYMSPEQIRGEAVDERADAWGFGCLMFECLAGVAAFPGDTVEDRLRATLEMAPDWRRIPDAVPADVRGIVEQCLGPRLDRRPADLEQIARISEHARHRCPASAPAPVRHNIPPDRSPYVSRAGELPRVRELLRRRRMLTLTGPGGCGKTRLAQQVVRSIIEDGDPETWSCHDGIWWVELSPISRGDQIPRAASLAWTQPAARATRPEAPPRETLIDDWREGRAVVVFDNCEHVLVECAALIEDILARCPDVRVIATSREPLGVAGEQLYRVPGLSYPSDPTARGTATYESVRLFETRASQSNLEFCLTVENTPAVLSICHRLEGMPLAIELAAARVATLPVEEVADRLGDVLDPQHVLELSIRHSVQLLSPPEEKLLGRLVVFRGGWTLEACEQVCGDSERPTIDGVPVIELLSRLVDRSLVIYVIRGDRARYHLLDTVRDYAGRHLLTQAAARRARDRLLVFGRDLAAEAHANFTGPDQVAWLDRVEVEHGNLGASIAWAAGGEGNADHGAALSRDLHVFWYVRGDVAEGRVAIEQAINRRTGAHDLLQMQLLNAAGILATRQLDLAAAARFYRMALAVAEQRGDTRRAAGILTNLGMVSLRQGNLEQSRDHHESSRQLYRELGDDAGEAAVDLNLAFVALEGRDLGEARRLSERSLPVFQAAGDRQRIASVAQNLGEIACMQKRTDDAARWLCESLDLAEQLGDQTRVSRAVLWLGLAAADRQSYEHAATLLAAAESLWPEDEQTGPASAAVEYESCRKHVRRHLPAAERDRAEGHGLAMTMEQAAAFARKAWSEADLPGTRRGRSESS